VLSLLAVITTYCVAAVIWQPPAAEEISPQSTGADHRMSNIRTVFSLLVELRFSEAQHKDQFLEDVRPVAEYVKAHEPDTLSYEVLLSDKDSLEVMIMERYRDKEVSYLQVHKSSAPFLAFRPKLRRMQEAGQVTVSGKSYIDSVVGFVERSTTLASSR